ncbi:hypothetical protein G6F32_016906 [Rhizopus arrhizus]|nr:hypothetical protein G6F32_016906 [Rhizopus arrhizus]
MGPVIQTHNITPGMSDPKDVKQNSAMVDSGISALKRWDRVLKAMVISPDRALEELNSDWTASQELADVLMRKPTTSSRWTSRTSKPAASTPTP